MFTRYRVMVRLETGGCVEEFVSSERVFIQDGALTFNNMVREADPTILGYWEFVKAYAPGKWVTLDKESEL